MVLKKWFSLHPTVESMNFKWLWLQLCLQPENIDSDSNSDSASTPAYQEQYDHFLDFPFDCIQTGDAVIQQHLFALTADKAGIVRSCRSWIFKVCSIFPFWLHFLDFPFDCIQTSDAVIQQHLFMLTVDKAGVDIADSFECGKVWKSLNLSTQSHS